MSVSSVVARTDAYFIFLLETNIIMYTCDENKKIPNPGGICPAPR